MASWQGDDCSRGATARSSLVNLFSGELATATEDRGKQEKRKVMVKNIKPGGCGS